jgi:hypothetical protein
MKLNAETRHLSIFFSLSLYSRSESDVFVDASGEHIDTSTKEVRLQSTAEVSKDLFIVNMTKYFRKISVMGSESKL